MWLVARIIRRTLNRCGDANLGRNRATIHALSRLTQYVVLTIAATLVLDIAGVAIRRIPGWAR